MNCKWIQAKGEKERQLYGCFIFGIFSGGIIKSCSDNHGIAYPGGYLCKRMDGCSERDRHMYRDAVYEGPLRDLDERGI